MNIAEDSNPNNPPRPNFNFSYPLPNTQPIQWNPGPPQFAPWGHSPNSPPARLVTFSAQPQHQQGPSQFHNMNFGQLLASSGQKIGQSSSDFDHTLFTPNHCKRKANLDIPVPRKQHITEEKMAQHMSRLHISTESHREHIPHGQIEDTASREKRLYICEEMRRLQTESILPTSLLTRIERPCMTVMVWQPPTKLPELIGDFSSSSSSSQMITNSNNVPTRGPIGILAVNSIAEDENDNNSGVLDLNNMEMDT